MEIPLVLQLPEELLKTLSTRFKERRLMKKVSQQIVAILGSFLGEILKDVEEWKNKLYRITFNCLSELCVELQEKIKGEKIK